MTSLFPLISCWIGLGLGLTFLRPQGGGIPSGGDGSMDFSDEDASALLALLEDT